MGFTQHVRPRMPTAFNLLLRFNGSAACSSRQSSTIAYAAVHGTSRQRAANVDVVNCKSSWQTNGKCVWGQKTQPLTKMSGRFASGSWMPPRAFFLFSFPFCRRKIIVAVHWILPNMILGRPVLGLSHPLRALRAHMEQQPSDHWWANTRDSFISLKCL